MDTESIEDLQNQMDAEQQRSASSVEDLQNLMDAEQQRVPSIFLNTVEMVKARATFIAGFAYYAIGFYPDSCCASGAYVLVNTLAFLFSVSTAGMASIFSYYLQRHHSLLEKYNFCMSAIFFEQVILALYYLSSICYLLGIGLIGFAYYPTTHYDWVPLSVMIVSCIAFIVANIHIIKSHMGFETTLGDGSLSEKLKLKKLDGDSIVRESPYAKRRGQQLHTFVLKVSSTVSGRAVFIAGLGQSGILRFMPSPKVFSSTDSSAHYFIILVSLAAAFAFVSGSLLTVLEILIPATGKRDQVAFSAYLMPVFKLSLGAYVLSFFVLFMSNIWVAYGCDFPSMNRITMSVGLTGMIILSSAAMSIWRSFNVPQESTDEEKESESNEDGSKEDDNMEKNERILKNQMNAINTCGSMSTFVVGYVYYNVLTFGSGVLTLSWNTSGNIQSRMFLWLNIFAGTFALLSAVFDTVITVIVSYLHSTSEKIAFLKSQWLICHACSWFYQLSLIGWFAVFGMFGFVKFSRTCWVPFWYAVFGIAVMVAGTLYLSYIRKVVHDDTANSNERQQASKTIDNPDEVAVCVSRPALLNSIAFSLIFIGGFGYFAVDFFDFSGESMQFLYLHAFCISYMTSMWVMAFADRYSYQMAKCHFVLQKIEFTKKTYWFYLMCLFLSYIVVLGLLIGFYVLGRYKTQIIDVGIGFTLILMAYYGSWTLTTYVKIKDEPLVEHTAITPEKKEAHIDRFVNQIMAGTTTAGFICGNVANEILFAVGISSYPVANAYYFMMCSITFALGLAALVISTLTVLCLGELEGADRKYSFVRQLKYLKLAIFAISVGCLLAWQSTVIAMGEVKYAGAKDDNDLPSVIFGFLGLIYLIVMYFQMKKISDETLVTTKRLESIDSDGSITRITSNPIQKNLKLEQEGVELKDV